MDIKKVRCHWDEQEHDPVDETRAIDVRKSCTGEEAVAHMKESAFKHKMYVYTTDEEALLDFIAVNWASVTVVE